MFAFRGFPHTPAFPVGGRSLDAAEVAGAQQLPVAIAAACDRGQARGRSPERCELALTTAPAAACAHSRPQD